MKFPLQAPEVTDFVLPDPRWETPSIMYPRTLPHGSVKVNKEHPIGRHVASCFPFSADNGDNDVSGHGRPLIVSGTLITKNSYGYDYNASTGDTNYIAIPTPPQINSDSGIDAIAANGITGVVHFRADRTALAGGNADLMILQTLVGAAVDGHLHFNNAGTTGQLGSWSTANAARTTLTSPELTVGANMVAAFSYRTSNNRNSICLDGVATATYSSHSFTSGHSVANHWLLGTGVTGNTLKGFDGAIYSVTFLDTYLSDAQLKQLCLDPYQFLIPA